MSEIGNGVDSESFCGDAEDMLGFEVARVSGAVGALELETGIQYYTFQLEKDDVGREITYLHHSQKKSNMRH